MLAMIPSSTFAIPKQFRYKRATHKYSNGVVRKMPKPNRIIPEADNKVAINVNIVAGIHFLLSIAQLFLNDSVAFSPVSSAIGTVKIPNPATTNPGKTRIIDEAITAN